MSIEFNENTTSDMDVDLDVFSADFFGQKEVEQEEATPEENVEETEVEDTASEAEVKETDESVETDEEEEVEPEKPVKKRNSAQDRIQELNTKYREEQRLREALEARLAKLEQKEQEVTSKKQEVNTEGPKPDDLNEDGTEKYELGEYDPKYQADLVKYLFKKEQAEHEAKVKLETEQKQRAEANAQLQAEWNEKLVSARERYPDFQEKGAELVDAFSDLEASYAEYLTNTLMSLEYGPDVFHYLSNNMDEARKIVNSGPAKATIALGRIEAKFAFAEEEKQKARPKVSKAPTPPEHLNKGSAVAKTEPRWDDDNVNLDALAKTLAGSR